tara:strand:- start:503 stop:952 length:450 start_codon:yes stop_codon:yes gene_type:complete
MDAFVTTEIKNTNQAQCVLNGTYFLNYSRKNMKACGYKNGDEVYVIVEGDKNPTIKLYNKKEGKNHKECGSTQIANNENKNDIFRMITLDSKLYFIQPCMTGLPVIRKAEEFKDVPILIGNLSTILHEGPSECGTKLKVKIIFPYQNVN